MTTGVRAGNRRALTGRDANPRMRRARTPPCTRQQGQVRPPLGQRPQRARPLEPGQRGSEAVVDAAGEGQVLGLALPVQPEAVRVGVRGGVAVGRRQQHRHNRGLAAVGVRPAPRPRGRTVRSSGPVGRSAGSPPRPPRPGPGRRPAATTPPSRDAARRRRCRSGSPWSRTRRPAAGRRSRPDRPRSSSPPASAVANRLITSSCGSRRRSSASRRNSTASSRPACRSSCAWRTVRTPSRDWPTSSPIWEKCVASAAGMPSSRLITVIGKPSARSAIRSNCSRPLSRSRISPSTSSTTGVKLRISLGRNAGAVSRRSRVCRGGSSSRNDPLSGPWARSIRLGDVSAVSDCTPKRGSRRIASADRRETTECSPSREGDRSPRRRICS